MWYTLTYLPQHHTAQHTTTLCSEAIRLLLIASSLVSTSAVTRLPAHLVDVEPVVPVRQASQLPGNVDRSTFLLQHSYNHPVYSATANLLEEDGARHLAGTPHHADSFHHGVVVEGLKHREILWKVS